MGIGLRGGGWVVRMLVDDTMQRCNAVKPAKDAMQRDEAGEDERARQWNLTLKLFRTSGVLTTKEMVIQMQVRSTYVRIPLAEFLH